MRIKKRLLLLIIGIVLFVVGIIPNIQNPTKTTLGESTQNTPTPQVTGVTNLLTVIEVIDGDTIITANGQKIRYLGINTPEKGQPFYEEAKKTNEDLVLGKIIQVETDNTPKDSYGRILAYVYVGDTFVNVDMVKKGMAISETIEPNVKYQNEILSTQKEARAACAGIWNGLCTQEKAKGTDNGCIQIVSIHADAAGNDNENRNDEWIAFANTCAQTISMDKWLLKDNSASNSYVFQSISLKAGKKVTLHSGCGTPTETDLYWSCPQLRSSIWNNDSDHAFLYNEKNILVSDYQY